MSKDSVTYQSLITLSKTEASAITEALVKSSPIGIETFSSQFQAVYDYWTTKPSDAFAAILNKEVEDYVNSGVWDELDVYHDYAIHTNDNGEALVNWKNPGTHDATLVNAPAFVAFEGFKGDGATQYIDSNYNLSTDSVNYALNSASFGFYCRTNFKAGGVYEMGARAAAGWSLFSVGASAGVGPILRLNDLTSAIAVNANAQGMWVGSRTASNVKKVYLNKNAIINTVDISTTIPAFDSYMLCYNNSGVAASFSQNQLSMGFHGAGLIQQNIDDLTDIYEVKMDAIGKGVIS